MGDCREGKGPEEPICKMIVYQATDAGEGGREDEQKEQERGK